MLGRIDAVANIAVKDLEVASKFYEETLGLSRESEMDGEVVTFKSGNTEIIVYRSEFAGTNRATALGWNVGNKIESLVEELTRKGVTFEHYNMPGAELRGDIYVYGQMKVAWFKDPDGNILSLMGGE